ncbi:MAG: protoporphyrinogen oxidase [Balneolaceae bacterium]
MKTEERVAIVGGGITGLTAALELQEAGFETVLFERRESVGGAIRSVRVNNWIVEYGPNTLQVRSERVYDYLEHLGLQDRIVEANPSASSRYVVRNGTLVQLPQSLKEAAFTSLLSRSGRVRVLTEPFRRRGEDKDETLSSFVRRRMGEEFLDYLIDPFVAGIYAGLPDQLSVRFAFPRLYELEQRYGSLSAGAMVKSVQRFMDRSFKTRLISFRDGIAELPEAIAGRLKEVRTGQEVTRLERSREGWVVHSEGMRHGPFGILILNIPLYRYDEQLLDGGGEILDVVRKSGYPPLSILLSGYQKDQIEHPLNGFGFLVPSAEKRKILGTLFSSSLFPGRAPEGHHLLTTFVGGGRQPELAQLESSELMDIVATEHRDLLGVKGEPRFADHIYWPKSIPHYSPDYGGVLSAVETLEKRHKNLYLAGNFRGGISVPDCICNGLDLAGKISDASVS